MAISQLTVVHVFRCEDGEAKISCGYRLPARYVISTVGPIGEHPKVPKNLILAALQVILTGAGKCLSEQPEGDEGEQSEVDCFSLHIHRHLRLSFCESFLQRRKSQRSFRVKKRKRMFTRTFRSPPARLPCAWSDTSWRGTRILLTGFYSPLYISSFNHCNGV